MSLYFSMPFISLLAVCFTMLAAWFWAKQINNFTIVDVFWSFNFAIIAAIVFILADGFETRKIIVCGISFLWSFRLGLHLSQRIFSHLYTEDPRYKEMQKNWSKNLNLTFFWFYQAQALSNVVLAIPFFIVAENKTQQISVLEYIGAAWWLFAVIGEGVADWQLKRFRRNPANKGKPCDYGLWYYSRHPNYFFQLMIWVGVFIFSLSSPYGYVAIICPFIVAYLLFKVTGIPMNEEQNLKSKGEVYKVYQRTTHVFIPWFKKQG